MTWDNSPELIPQGRLQWDTHEVSVEHAAGFSGGGVLEPWASSDFLRKSWGIVEPAAKSWGSDGIVRGCTNHGPRTASCDSAACED